MTSPVSGLPRQDVIARLFQPGERVGWYYLQRELLLQPFPEPAPPNPAISPDHAMQIARTRQTLANYQSGRGSLSTIIGGPLPFFFVRAYLKRQARAAEQAYQGAIAQQQEQAHRAHYAWQGRQAQFEQAERERVSTLPAWWGAAPRAEVSRMEVFGGDRFGWEGFVTVFGSSCLGSGRRLTVVDFSGDEVAVELAGLARAAGKRVDEQGLPDGLDGCDLLAGLDGQELADALVEALHRDEVTADRAARAVDARILETVSAALAPEVTAGKLAEAMLALMGEPARPALLTNAQWEQVATELFSANYIQQTHDRFRQIHAYISPVTAMGTRRREATPAADLATVTFRAGIPAVRLELLTDLAMQWATRVVNTSAADVGTLLVAGADKATRGQLESLSEACQRRGVRLGYLFRHLRETSLSMIGGGLAGIMRLGNHHEAAEAADFIGREHSFKLSQLTNTSGGSLTHTWGGSSSDTESTGSSSGSGGGSNQGTSRTWGTSASDAAGRNWSQAAASQRVYEYSVEPTAIQGLPDYAMILVEPGPVGPAFRIVDVNPDIASRPDATAQPIPPEYVRAAEAGQAAKQEL